MMSCVQPRLCGAFFASPDGWLPKGFVLRPRGRVGLRGDDGPRVSGLVSAVARLILSCDRLQNKALESAEESHLDYPAMPWVINRQLI